MKKSYGTWIVSIGLIAGLAGASVFIASRRATNSLELVADAPITARSQQVVIGGVRRPLSDVLGLEDSVTKKKSNAKNESKLTEKDRHPYGTTPKLASDLNPSVAKAFAAVKSETKSAPELVSAMFQPEQFDLELYQANKQAYLELSVPGRVWQTSQPGDGVPVLSGISKTQQKMKQGETVRLRVRSAPNSPVTFTSFDLGAFANGLTSITVEADDRGIATANFSAPSGTAYAVNLLAGSPLATGQVRFRVIAIPPID